jgi:hypothetical protein
MVQSRVHLTWGHRLTGAAVATVLLAAPLTGAAAAVPKNNGTIKVHSVGTPLDEHANEPKQVCEFYLAGFGYDDDQMLGYAFETQPGGTATGPTGSFAVGPTNGNPAGVGQSGDLTLPDGQYKVTVTSSDGDKTKVFKVACTPDPTGTDDDPAPEIVPVPLDDPPPGDTVPPADTTSPDGTADTDGDDSPPADPAGDPSDTADVPAAAVPTTDAVVKGEIVQDTDAGPAPVGGVHTGGGALAGA